MKKLLVSALMLGSVATAAPAFAQASGSVDVSGTVAAKCSAVTPISGSITLGELAKADGTVDPAFAGNTGGLSRTFTIKCNGANPKLTVEAKPLVNAAATNSPNGYTNTVHYTATVVATGAKGGSATVADQSLSSGATSGQVGDRLAAVSNNLSLTVGSGLTADSTAILDAGTYAGKVEITVAPAA
ncbi:hypothetical protein FIM10_14645 [Sphingomonadales bacterium 56]|uniref:hypothetical protein n=1 Tax=unclassified Sphingobium TaxID=2611147 RepID=UPI00191AC8C4|nr:MULTISPECIES: hypothetical protein [unclassified Sphingobium]MBY2929912.1 hypothetical protein [Sphingomonadales bacterium 56]MBY2959839.1 hypothetical protein [Sphingomonadales bacterium 58]CAD7339843.1 hypothetical protein SPHS8_02805 [Sphingobium sp. S8]CAD7340408.1 hypothetical protein SPHS6_02957 [Sphingobium sp. S6]